MAGQLMYGCGYRDTQSAQPGPAPSRQACPVLIQLHGSSLQSNPAIHRSTMPGHDLHDISLGTGVNPPAFLLTPFPVSDRPIAGPYNAALGSAPMG